MARGYKTGGRVKGTPNRKTRDIEQAAQQYTQEALLTLVSIAQAGESDAARVAAACAILDRGHGRPKQRSEISTDGPIAIEVIYRHEGRRTTAS